MSRTLVLQDWTTLTGVADQEIVQPASEWLDVGSHADGIFWLEIRDSGTTDSPGIRLETSVLPEDEHFTTLTPFMTAMEATVSTFKVSRFADDVTPLLRYVRWKAGFVSAEWTMIFRICGVLKHP